jgi:hypothetical protein
MANNHSKVLTRAPSLKTSSLNKAHTPRTNILKASTKTNTASLALQATDQPTPMPKPRAIAA